MTRIPPDSDGSPRPFRLARALGLLALLCGCKADSLLERIDWQLRLLHDGDARDREPTR